MSDFEFVQKLVSELPEEQLENISDGYHTFKELYEFRLVYNACLFNYWSSAGLYDVHKSIRHHDGRLCFGEGKWFIVVAMLPTGQISNHYPIEEWRTFDIPEVPKAKYPFDEYTPVDVITRLRTLQQ